MTGEKTAFISYRHTNYFTARAVYQYLTTQGFDVFLDHQSMRNGAFKRIINDQIVARTHFIVILTPSALKRCHEPNDWLRLEIEWAIEHQRNIVPLFFDGFDFGDFDRYLQGKLSILAQYNALRVPSEFFDEAMARLTNEYLNIPLNVVLHPIKRSDQLLAEAQQARVNKYPAVTARQLSAEEFFERGVQWQISGEFKDAIRDYTHAIRLNPYFAEAYNNRGTMYSKFNYMKRAIADYTQAITINAKYSIAFANRGFELSKYGYFDDAVLDYTQAITLDSQNAIVYHGRGQIYYKQKQFDKALNDYTRAIDLNPAMSKIYNDRGIIWFKLGRMVLSRLDLDQAITLHSNNPIMYMNRAQIREKQDDLNGAIEDYEVALVLNPKHDTIHQHLKRLYRKRRQLLGRLPK